MCLKDRLKLLLANHLHPQTTLLDLQVIMDVVEKFILDEMKMKMLPERDTPEWEAALSIAKKASSEIYHKAPVNYVSSSGLVRLPEKIIRDFDLINGGGITFMKNNAGKYEVWTIEEIDTWMCGDENEPLA